jgi:hypothetical protein
MFLKQNSFLKWHELIVLFSLYFTYFLILYSRLAINPTVLLIVFFIQALSKGTMEEILRQQIEKLYH